MTMYHFSRYNCTQPPDIHQIQIQNASLQLTCSTTHEYVNRLRTHLNTYLSNEEKILKKTVYINDENISTSSRCKNIKVMLHYNNQFIQRKKFSTDDCQSHLL